MNRVSPDPQSRPGLGARSLSLGSQSGTEPAFGQRFGTNQPLGDEMMQPVFTWDDFAFWALIGFCIIGIIYFLIVLFSGDSTCEKFSTISDRGFRYNAMTLRFETPVDRSIGIEEAIKELAKSGKVYTLDEIKAAKIPDWILLNFLESENEADSKDKAKMVVALDPTYHEVIQLIASKRRNRSVNKFTLAERNMIYNLIVLYFTTKGSFKIRPLSNWTDNLLIQAFQQGRMPAPNQFV